MERYICIHGHFYQPPRENAWLEHIEPQDSAYPFHDWNERIAAECYMPNGTSRILDGEGNVEKITNNYAHISFNFGPTLLAWLQDKEPATYRSILDADKESQRRFSGHGSAIAQAFNHTILPLSTARDKYSQILWGIRDFEHRFGRKPEGMWLPETAVDLEVLDIMAKFGIRFTILSPHQAKRTRRLRSRVWRDASSGGVDPSTPYVVRLPSKRRIAVFFCDCWTAVSSSPPVSLRHFPKAARGLKLCTSQRTVRFTAIIINMARWLSPMRSVISRVTMSRSLRTTPSTCKGIRR